MVTRLTVSFPLSYPLSLLPSLQLARAGLDVELCSRCAVFLLRCHTSRITHTASLAPEVSALQAVLRDGVGGYRTLVGTNVAALRYLSKALSDRKSAHTMDYEQLMAPVGPATAGNSSSSQNRDKNKGKKNKHRHSSGTASSSQAKRPRK